MEGIGPTPIREVFPVFSGNGSQKRNRRFSGKTADQNYNELSYAWPNEINYYRLS